MTLAKMRNQLRLELLEPLAIQLVAMNAQTTIKLDLALVGELVDQHAHCLSRHLCHLCSWYRWKLVETAQLAEVKSLMEQVLEVEGLVEQVTEVEAVEIGCGRDHRHVHEDSNGDYPLDEKRAFLDGQ